MRRLLILVAMLVWLGGFAAAQAQPSSTPLIAGAEPSGDVSYALWSVEGSRVRLRYMLPQREARTLTPPGRPLLRTPAVADAVIGAITVSSSAGPCSAIDQGEGVGEIYTMALTPGLYRFEIIFDCKDASAITLHDTLLFKEDSRHITYASVRNGAAPAQMVQFSAGRQDLVLPDNGAAVPGPSASAYAVQGGKALFLRLDALAALAALLLLASRWKDLRTIADGLAAGYAAAFALGWTGLAMTHAPLAGAATGLVVAALAVSALRRKAADAAVLPTAWRTTGALVIGLLALGAAVAAAKAGPSSAFAIGGITLFGLALVWTAGAGSPPWMLALPAALFGVLDGMALSSDVAVLGLPMTRVWPALAGYDTGAALTAGLLAAIGMAAAWLVSRKIKFIRKAAVDLAGAGLIGVGVFWFVTRLYS